MQVQQLVFSPIILELHASACVAFRRDSFLCSFGVDGFFDEAGPQLSVSPTNARALAFYRKHGWRDLGLRPGRDNVHLMECDVPAAVGG